MTCSKLRSGLGVAVVICAAAAMAPAGGPCRAPAVVVRQRVEVVSSGLTIVPFAVPVAVPVATYSAPSVLYAYGAAMPRAEGTAWAPNAALSAEPVASSAEPIQLTPESVLRQACIKCHQGAAAKAGLTLFDDAGQLRPKLPRHVMWEMVAEGKMPPRGAVLSEGAKRLLQEWARLPRDFEY